jgi:putative SOS response-associated peptidase YedK
VSVVRRRGETGQPPSGSNWIHEIKHDGYRLMARRDPVGIRLLTKRGTDWSAHVAPTELVPVLVAGEGVVLARFGIHRLGSGDKPRPPLLNVRTDGMRKGQFRKHLKERRCVIPCEGFYEWRDEGGKQPYYFSHKDGKPLMLAGIWEIAEYKGDSRVAFAHPDRRAERDRGLISCAR